ncbi:MAG: type IV pilus biogenesis/stability protein PilW [Burkholderiales bacterium]
MSTARAARAWVVALAATLATACATNDPAAPQPGVDRGIQSPDPDTGVVGEMRDARTRAKAHTDLAGAYYELGNLGVALEEARIALQADPNYPAAYNVLGLVNLELKDTAAAEANFRRGLQLAPQDPDLNHNYGWFLCQTGRDEQSIQWFLNAVRNPLYPTPAKSFAAAGRCLVKRNPTEAATYFDRALRLDPNSFQAMLPYAELLYRRGQLQEAKGLVVRFNRLVPDGTPESLWLGVRIERKLGDRLAEASLANQLRRRYAGSPEYQALQRGEYD